MIMSISIHNCIVHVYAIVIMIIIMILAMLLLVIVDDTSCTYALAFTVTFWGIVRITRVTFYLE